MRWSRRARERTAVLMGAILLPSISTASPFSSISDTELLDLQNTTLLSPRGGCGNPCGYNGWLCCGESQQCFTDYNNRASCAAGTAGTASSAPAGYWTTYYSTWIETGYVTHTSSWTAWVGPSQPAATWTPTSSWAPVQTAPQAVCNWDQGESSCGNICCASYQYCAVAGQCAASAASSSPAYSAPIRPTSSGAIIYTQTATVTTTTLPFETPVGTAQAASITAIPGGLTVDNNGGGGGLSGGAIAGIVIGVLLILFLLFLLLLFLCFRGAWHALLAVFGLGRKGRRRTEVEYDEYRRHGSRATSRRYYDDGVRVDKPVEKKKSGLGFGPLVAGLGALGIAFGLKKRHDRKKRLQEEKSDYSSAYMYTDSYTGSDSSSGRRTHSTRRTDNRSRR